MTLSSMASGSAETALYSMRMALLDAPSSSLDQPLSKTVSNRPLPVGCRSFQFFPSRSTPGLHSSRNMAAKALFWPCSCSLSTLENQGASTTDLFAWIGSVALCHAPVRMSSVRHRSTDTGGATSSSPLSASHSLTRACSGWSTRSRSSPSTWSSFPPTSPDRYSSAGSGIPVSGSITMRSPSFSMVSMSSRVSSSRPMRSRSTCPTRSRLTAIASTGSSTCSGIGGTGVTTLLESMSPLASNPLGPIFSKL